MQSHGKKSKRFLISGASSQIGLELVKKLYLIIMKLLDCTIRIKKRLELLEKNIKI